MSTYCVYCKFDFSILSSWDGYFQLLIVLLIWHTLKKTDKGPNTNIEDNITSIYCYCVCCYICCIRRIFRFGLCMWSFPLGLETYWNGWYIFFELPLLRKLCNQRLYLKQDISPTLYTAMLCPFSTTSLQGSAEGCASFLSHFTYRMKIEMIAC